MTATDVVVALNEPEVLKLDFQHGARVLRALDLDRTWIVRARHLSTRPQTAPNSLQWLTARSNEAASGHSQAASRCRSTSSAASFGHMISGWVVMRTVALVYVCFTSTVLTTAICRFRPSPAHSDPRFVQHGSTTTSHSIDVHVSLKYDNGQRSSPPPALQLQLVEPTRLRVCR